MDHATGRAGPFGAEDAVASTEPARISAKETAMVGVKLSPRNSAPAATATAGLT
ncbi:hypothetical protein ACFV23_09380 [Streptomyces sp. NPDC059627]